MGNTKDSYKVVRPSKGIPPYSFDFDTRDPGHDEQIWQVLKMFPWNICVHLTKNQDKLVNDFLPMAFSWQIKHRVIDTERFFNLEFSDVNKDGRLDLLVTKNAQINGEVYAYEIPDDFR